MIGRLASSAVAVGISTVGIVAIVAPKPSAGQYGLPVDERWPLAYVRALGARDLVFGLIALRFLAGGEMRPLAAVMGIGTLVAVGDFCVVAAARGAGRHLIVHAVGGAGMLSAWAFTALDAQA